MSTTAPRHAPTSLWTVLLWTLVGGLAGSTARGAAEWICVLALHAPLWAARAGVNVIGGLGMGWSCAALTSPDGEHLDRGELPRHRAAAAFFGGFTTVSGFAWDGASAFIVGEHTRLALLLAIDGAVGVAACALGVWLGMRNAPGLATARQS